MDHTFSPRCHRCEASCTSRVREALWRPARGERERERATDGFCASPRSRWRCRGQLAFKSEGWPTPSAAANSASAAAEQPVLCGGYIEESPAQRAGGLPLTSGGFRSPVAILASGLGPPRCFRSPPPPTPRWAQAYNPSSEVGGVRGGPAIPDPALSAGSAAVEAAPHACERVGHRSCESLCGRLFRHMSCGHLGADRRWRPLGVAAPWCTFGLQLSLAASLDPHQWLNGSRRAKARRGVLGCHALHAVRVPLALARPDRLQATLGRGGGRIGGRGDVAG